jgi:hypothetical protein
VKALLLGTLLALAVSPTLAVSSTGEPLARKALAIAKRADAKATKALASKAFSQPGNVGDTGPKGDTGSPGERGTEGPRGIDGAPGPRGAEGAAGRVGDAGPQGPKGDQGDAGTASLDALSTTNPADVVLDGSSLLTTVLTLPIHHDTAGSAFISYDAQLNDENGTSDGVLCELRLDAETLGERYVSVPGNSVVSVSGSALANLDVGDHVAGLSCRKSSSLSLVQFPQGRARLTLLAG